MSDLPASSGHPVPSEPGTPATSEPSRAAASESPDLSALTPGDVCAAPSTPAAHALGAAVERCRAPYVERWGATVPTGVVRSAASIDLDRLDAEASSIAAAVPDAVGTTDAVAADERCPLPTILDAHHWSRDLGRLADSWAVAWEAGVTVRLVRLEGACQLAPVGRPRAVIPLRASTTVAGLPATEIVGGGNGDALVVPAGASVELAGPAGDDVVVVDLVTIGVGDAIAALIRSAGFDPLLRADLPLDEARPLSSYGGALLDGPGALADRLAAVASDAMSRATWWFRAHLRGAPILERGPSDDRTRLRPVAPLCVIDSQQTAAGGVPDEHVVAAVGGRVLPLTPERQAALIDVLDGRRERVDDDLGAALSVAGWCVADDVPSAGRGSR